MATLGYGICLIASIFVIIYMAYRNYETINTYYWTIICIIPIVILGYFLKTKVQSPEGAMISLCFIYLDSTVLLLLVIFAMLGSMNIRANPIVKIVSYGFACAHLAMVWLTTNNTLYYSSLDVIPSSLGTITRTADGPLKVFHLVYLAVVMSAIIGIIIAGFARRGTYSRRTLFLFAAVTMAAVGLYAAEVILSFDFGFLPYLYVVSELIIALDYDHSRLNDIYAVIAEQQKYNKSIGFVFLDAKRRFMSCNSKSKEFLPELSGCITDERIPEEGTLRDFLEGMLDDYALNGKAQRKFKLGDMTCACDVEAYRAGKKQKLRGYLFEIWDATDEQKTLDVMTSYNETLNAEIKEKTQNIADIQRKIVVGMANVIENRDNNTGGHVKRTSDIISIIVDEIMRRNKIKITDELAHDIVRAAPMHDLGKLMIDSSILCKNGRLTPEEYEIMKSHSANSGELVRIVLEGVEEKHFVDTAFNIARYHHERWDGRGYPDGLVGSMIPVESRIMAIADVYDALVSKRCYKEPMSFEQAKVIMCEGMGTQFDPNLKPVFLGCCERLEEYYRSNAEENTPAAS